MHHINEDHLIEAIKAVIGGLDAETALDLATERSCWNHLVWNMRCDCYDNDQA